MPRLRVFSVVSQSSFPIVVEPLGLVANSNELALATSPVSEIVIELFWIAVFT
jgi:hypothetical protein